MRVNLVLYALCDFEPVEKFKGRSEMIEFRCFSYSRSSRVENKLWSSCVMVVEFRVPFLAPISGEQML